MNQALESRFGDFKNYLISRQNKKPEIADEIARKTDDFFHSKKLELQESDSKLYFSTIHRNEIVRSIHCVSGRVFICLNRKRDSKDLLLGFGDDKTVHEAYEYNTGKVYARVVGFTDHEIRCANYLRGIPNIVQTYCTYEYQSPKSGKIKSVAIQERIDGKTLMSSWERIQKLTLEERSDIIKTLLKTIDTIHKKGVTHRDLHIENILLDFNLQPILIDFGKGEIVFPPNKISEQNEKLDMNRLRDCIRALLPIEQGKEPFINFILTLKNKTAAEAFDEFNKITAERCI